MDALTEAGRVDLGPTGNRVITGPGALLDTTPMSLELRRPAVWIVPAGPSSWIAVLDDGSGVVIQVDADGDALVETTDWELTPGETSRPPLATASGRASFDDFLGLFDDPLDDSRVVAAGDSLIALSGPTERYPHGVLGDAVEAAAIEVASAMEGARVLVELDEPDVFEAVSPMIADVDDDGTEEVVMTVSNGDVGARLAAYSLDDGSVVAESDPIGLGNRWRNLLAVAPVGPDGEVEIVDVRTPHIGGVVQFFRVVDDRMELVASAENYSTHAIGSRNLDLGIVSDADGDGRLDVVLPTRGMDEIAVITRDDGSPGGALEAGRVGLGGRMVSNLAASVSDDRVHYAVGLDDGTLLLWR